MRTWDQGHCLTFVKGHLLFVCCLFGFNVRLNNFSVISRQCLFATGSSMLTCIVLSHWSIMPQTFDMTPHPVTLSWHWVVPVSLSAKRGAASTTFNDFVMSRPGIECVTSRSPKRTLHQLSYRDWLKVICTLKQLCQHSHINTCLDSGKRSLPSWATCFRLIFHKILMKKQQPRLH